MERDGKSILPFCSNSISLCDLKKILVEDSLIFFECHSSLLKLLCKLEY